MSAALPDDISPMDFLRGVQSGPWAIEGDEAVLKNLPQEEAKKIYETFVLERLSEDYALVHSDSKERMELKGFRIVDSKEGNYRFIVDLKYINEVARKAKLIPYDSEYVLEYDLLESVNSPQFRNAMDFLMQAAKRGDQDALQQIIKTCDDRMKSSGSDDVLLKIKQQAMQQEEQDEKAREGS